MKMPEIDVEKLEYNHGSLLCTYAKCADDCENCAIHNNDNMEKYVKANRG